MAKITINCRNCGDRKQCLVRKNFIEFVEENYKSDICFTLKCPFKKSKFEEGLKVAVTIGVGRYSEEYKHECLMDENEYSVDDPCDGCKFADKCKHGEVTHVNTKYKKYIKIDAEIIGPLKNGSCQVLSIDYDKLKVHLNGRDQVFLKKINESLVHTFDSYNPDVDEFLQQLQNKFYIISKNKFINSISTAQ